MDRSDIDAARQEAEGGPRRQKTFYLTEEITARVNSVIFWGRAKAVARSEATGQVADLDLVPSSASALVESALWAEVLRLEAELNEGKPFLPAPGKLAPGPGESGKQRMRTRRTQG